MIVSTSFFSPEVEWPHPPRPPLFLTHTPPASDGFTAVILSYDRLESLFQVMLRVAETPSLKEILVVWNNQELEPPAAGEWPQKLAKPFKIVRTAKNVLSNRFAVKEKIWAQKIVNLLLHFFFKIFSVRRDFDRVHLVHG